MLRVKDSVSILQESDDMYQFVYSGTRRVKRFQVDPLVKDVISEALSEKYRAVTEEVLATKYNLEDIRQCIDALIAEGILVNSDSFSNPRFLRQQLFIDDLTTSPEETESLQRRIEQSTIAVMGTGGIGTWIVNGLYQIGVGTIKISDPDTIHESNLNRQLFFTASDVGRYKVDVIQERLHDTNIIPYKKKLAAEEDISEIIDGCNLIVNCADMPSISETSRIIDGYATERGISYTIAGGYNMHLGMVGPILTPGRTACYECVLDKIKQVNPLTGLKLIKDVTQTGSIGPMAGAIANLHVMDIFKYLIGKGTINDHRITEIDFMDFEVKWIPFEKRPLCKRCNAY